MFYPTGLAARHALNGMSKASLNNKVYNTSIDSEDRWTAEKRKRWINKRIIGFGGRDFGNDS